MKAQLEFRGKLMTESEYFDHLEMRVSRELAGMREKELRRLWCDGFLPEKFVITNSGSHVAGRVWVGESFWNFVLLLGPARVPRTEVNWAALLPADDVTGWLYLDFEREFMKIRLSAAHKEGAAK